MEEKSVLTFKGMKKFKQEIDKKFKTLEEKVKVIEEKVEAGGDDGDGDNTIIYDSGEI